MTTMATNWINSLRSLGACHDAVSWAEAGGYATLDAAWAACEQPSWMLWYAGRVAGERESPGHRKIVAVACEIARLVLLIFEAERPGDERPRKAIEAAERYAVGEDVPVADRGAADAAAAAAAADAAAYAADDADRAATRLKMKSDILAIVRKHYPVAPRSEA